ncbi:tudor and KH domain-containing protein [Elysia marginata]|uniref:Tudor and KH domain-containing protein n=1 Tax=Elysia marginata TaxID=1093978 RepID=A0AAV4EN60_9GAST|nr:tudor and KH domain-containing protein [Elysia marginata]
MLSAVKVAQVALAVAMPTTIILLYWWYSRSSTDEDVYGRQKVMTTKQTRIEMSVPKKAVGSIIGKQGVVIKQIQKESGARVKFFDRDEAGESGGGPTSQRSLVILGTAEAAQQAELMIHQVIAEIPEVLTEEIEVPHYSIGRLIGKGGKTIREMCLSSGAKMEINRFEDYKGPNEPRVVKLMGSRSQIDSILDLIAEKLEEEEQFRNKLSTSAANRDNRDNRSPGQARPAKEPVKLKSVPAPEEKDLWDNFDDALASKQDTLPNKGSGYFEVYVSAVENPGHFWVQAVGQKALQLEEIQNEITSFVSTTEAKENYRLADVVEGQMVAACFEEGDSVYYRAKVLGETPDGKVDLYFVDFGDNTYADKGDLFKLRSDFTSFPHQAIECQLANVEPTDIGAALVEKGFAGAADSANHSARSAGASNQTPARNSQTVPAAPSSTSGVTSTGQRAETSTNQSRGSSHGGLGS